MADIFVWNNGIVVSASGIPLHMLENVLIMKREIEENSFQLEDHQLAFVRGLPNRMSSKQFEWLWIYYQEATTDYPDPY